MCAGVPGYERVCAGVLDVCAGMRSCAQVYMDVCAGVRRAWVCPGVHGCVWVWRGVCGCVQVCTVVCMGMCMCVG